MKYLLLCGVHGNEQNAVLSTIKAHNLIMQESHESIQIEGLVVNTAALREDQREVPEPSPKTNDMNRMYDSEPEFNADEAIETIKKKVAECDVVIDVHNSIACANSILISNSDYAGDYVKFANSMGICYIVTESATATAKKYAIESGKIGFTVELGGMGFCPEFNTIIAKNVKFIQNLVMSLETYVQRGGRFERRQPMVQNCCVQTLFAHHEGVVDYYKSLGEMTTRGEVIAKIISPQGQIVEEIVAPFDGWIADAMPKLWVQPGGDICEMQPAVQNV